MQGSIWWPMQDAWRVGSDWELQEALGSWMWKEVPGPAFSPPLSCRLFHVVFTKLVLPVTNWLVFFQISSAIAGFRALTFWDCGQPFSVPSLSSTLQLLTLDPCPSGTIIWVASCLHYGPFPFLLLESLFPRATREAYRTSA